MEDKALAVELTAQIASNYVANNKLSADELPALISTIYSALSAAASGTPEVKPEPEVAKPTAGAIRKSVTPDALISFVDGKSYKSLKRHLGRHGLTPEGYRAQYGLPKDYPMVSPNYSAQRSEMAKKIGLGQGVRKPKTAPAKKGR